MGTVRSGTLALLLLAAAVACAGARRGGDPSPSAVALPREASRSPDGSPSWDVPLAGRASERNRCIDRELAARDLNEFGDARGTTYPEGEPLEVAKGADRHEYVMRRHRGIAAQCSRAPGEGDQ
jgi:hypothetical protein